MATPVCLILEVIIPKLTPRFEVVNSAETASVIVIHDQESAGGSSLINRYASHTNDQAVGGESCPCQLLASYFLNQLL